VSVFVSDPETDNSQLRVFREQVLDLAEHVVGDEQPGVVQRGRRRRNTAGRGSPVRPPAVHSGPGGPRRPAADASSPRTTPAAEGAGCRRCSACSGGRCWRRRTPPTSARRAARSRRSSARNPTRHSAAPARTAVRAVEHPRHQPAPPVQTQTLPRGARRGVAIGGQLHLAVRVRGHSGGAQRGGAGVGPRDGGGGRALVVGVLRTVGTK
jgi:hypothetical protein